MRASPLQVTVGLAAALLLAGCEPAPAILDRAGYDRLVGDAKPAPVTCTGTCGGRVLIEGWATLVGWDRRGTSLSDDQTTLTMTGDHSAILQGQAFGGKASVELQLAPGSTGVLVAGVEVLNHPNGRGVWIRIDSDAGTITGIHEAIKTTDATPSISFDVSAPPKVRLDVDCATLSLTVGAETVRVAGTFALEADALVLRHTGDGTVAITGLGFESDCTDEELPTCEESCSGGTACRAGICTALGACAPVDSAPGTLCDDGDGCTAPDFCDDGACAGPDRDCDDGDSCTKDSCSATKSDCVHAQITGCTAAQKGYTAAMRVGVFVPTEGLVNGAPGPQSRAESAMERQNEPVEVALRAGLPANVDLYLSFEGALDTGIVGDGVQIDDLGSEFAPGAVGQALDPTSGVHLEVAAPSGGPMTFMLWTEAPDPLPDPVYAAGFFPPPGEGSPLAFELKGGEWRFGKTPFGAATTGWHHLAATWDPNGAVGRLYLDGALTATFTDGPALGIAKLVFGPPKTPAEGTTVARLKVDEVVLLRRVAHPSEIAGYRRLRKAFGTSAVEGVTTQGDYDDVRVRKLDQGGGNQSDDVPYEVIGRRAHGDTGAPAKSVAALYRMGVKENSAIGDAEAHFGLVTATEGAFYDRDGAFVFDDTTTQLWTNRTEPLLPPFTIEFWARLDDITPDCGGGKDGAMLLQSATGPNGGKAEGFQFRVCDGQPRFELKSGSSEAMVEAKGTIEDGNWHHLLVTATAETLVLFLDGIEQGRTNTPDEVTDGLFPLTPMYEQKPEGSGSSLTKGALDDLVIHRRAVSPGYVYDRVHPAIPLVRFLVSTGPDAPYTLPDFAIDLGNPTAEWHKPLSDCDSLFSECTGWLGYWEFDPAVGAEGRLTPDLTTAGRHGHFATPPTAAAGRNGDAVEAGSNPFSVSDSIFATLPFTVEVALRPDAATGTLAQLLVSSASSWELAVSNLTVSQSVGETVTKAPGLELGEWALVGGGAEATAVTAFVEGVEGWSSAVVTPPASGPAELIVGGAVGGGGLPCTIESVRVMSRVLLPSERLHSPRLSWTIK